MKNDVMNQTGKNFWDIVSNFRWEYRKLFLDRIMSQSLLWQLVIVAVIVIVLFVILVIVNCIIQRVFGQGLSMYELFYSLIDANAWSEHRNGNPQPYPISLLKIFAYFGAMVVFSGLLISILTNYFSRRIVDYKNGKTLYIKNNHHVILGYDEIVPSIVLNIFNSADTPKDTYVLIQSALPCDQVREKLQRSPANNYMNNIILNFGHRTSTKDLKKLYLPNALGIYIVGDRSKPTHDSMNFESLVNIYNILQPTPHNHLSKLVCVLEDMDTLSVTQQVDLIASYQVIGITPRFYNFYAEWARQVLIKEKYGERIELSGRGGTDREYPQKQGLKYQDREYLHIVIIGVNRLGVAIGTEAAKIIHYPNFERSRKLKTRISFIDVRADEEMELFMTRYRQFFQVQSCYYKDCSQDEIQEKRILPSKFKGTQAEFLDVDFEFIKGNVFSTKIQSLLESWASENNPMSIFIAFRNQQKGLALALNFPRKVYDKSFAIYVRQTRSDALFGQLRAQIVSYSRTYLLEGQKMVENRRESLYKNLYPFGMTDIACDILDQVQIQAELLMLLDRNDSIRQQVLTLEYEKSNWDKLKEDAHKKWYSQDISLIEQNGYYYMACAIPYRLSILRNMRGLETKDESLDLHDLNKEEVSSLVMTEHNRWNVEKLFSGYQKLEIEEEAFNAHKRADMRLGIVVVNEQRPYSYDIRAYNNKNDVSSKDREMIALIPRIVRASRLVHVRLEFDDASGMLKEVSYKEQFNDELGKMESLPLNN